MNRAIKIAIAVACIAFVVVLCAAGCSPISAGTITRKDFTPAHVNSWIWCHPVGKVTICQPMTTFVPDEWTFQLVEGEQTGWVDVTEDTFNRYEVGDFFEAAR